METSKFKIALVIPWYGTFPWYWKFFLHSIRYNPSIDFILVTDENIKESLPSNLIVIPMPFTEVKILAEKKLGFTISLEYPYKLCDFKPAYGLIFEDFLHEYDFWGHGDIDLIFGNIRKFITDSILEKHELISVRRDFLTGYFMLFKNIDKMNLLFTKSKDYQMIYKNPRSFCFDECNHMHTEIQFNRRNILDIDSDIESMEHVVQREIQDKRLSAFFEFLVVEGAPGNIKWENGSLYYKNQYEILLYHFIMFKSFNHLILPTWEDMPETIEIGKHFITSPSQKLIDKLKTRSRRLIGDISLSVQSSFRKRVLKGLAFINKKKNISKESNLIGGYRKGHLSILYKILIKNNQLILSSSKYMGTPLIYLWSNTFSTPDFNTIVKTKNVNGKFIFEIRQLNAKKQQFVKEY